MIIRKISNLLKKPFLVLPLLKLTKISAIEKVFWNMYAKDIDKNWGLVTTDFDRIQNIFDSLKPKKILEIGAGSGRLLPLYLNNSFDRVLLQDISTNAKSITLDRYPSAKYEYVICNIKDIDEKFDLIISNKVLSAFDTQRILPVIEHLCNIGSYIYIYANLQIYLRKEVFGFSIITSCCLKSVQSVSLMKKNIKFINRGKNDTI